MESSRRRKDERATNDAGLLTTFRELERALAVAVRECARAGVDYLPVVFPGFSTSNLRRNGRKHRNDEERQKPFNEIPREGGTFFWDQLYRAFSVAGGGGGVGGGARQAVAYCGAKPHVGLGSKGPLKGPHISC